MRARTASGSVAGLQEQITSGEPVITRAKPGPTGLQKRITSGEPVITPAKIEKLAALLRDQLHNGPPELRQAYVRLAMREVTVKDKEIRITGSKAVLARAATQDLDKTPPGVLSFVREWRARKESIRTSCSAFSKSGIPI